jgi:hypothetical protein
MRVTGKASTAKLFHRVNADHPIQELAFFLPEETDKQVVAECELLIKNLLPMREWVLSPPGTFDEDSDDAPGGCLRIYSALPPNQLPREIDERHFQEVTLLVQQLQNLSREHRLPITFYLDSKLVGEIENGKQDVLLEKGLLGEWKKALNAHNGQPAKGF